MGGKKTGANPTDRGKKGVKRSLLTEGHGIPIGLSVDGANRHDMKLFRRTIESIVIERPDITPEQPQGMCLDKGYDYDEVRETLEKFGSQPILGLVEKKLKRSHMRQVTKHDDG